MTSALEELPWDPCRCKRHELEAKRLVLRLIPAEQTRTSRSRKCKRKARLKRVARYLPRELELVLTFTSRRSDANWTGQDSEDQTCFSRAVVRLKQTRPAQLALVGARGVGRLRHLHRKELWLQDQVAKKIIVHGRVPSEDNEADLGTKFFEKDKIKKCVAKMSMVFAGAWAGEQMSVVSGTSDRCGRPDVRVRIGIVMGVVLLVEVGVVLLRRGGACIVLVSQTPTGKVTGEPEVAHSTGLHDSEEHAN